MEGESEIRRWDELIPDALGLIFKNLQFQEVWQVIPRVCKSWCKVVEGPCCWQKIDIDEWSKQCRPDQLDRMIRTLIKRSSGSLRELSVSCVNDDKIFAFIADNAASLQTLTLRRSSVSNSIVSQLASSFSSITFLDLSYCCNISTQAFEAIGRNCRNLVSLSWNMHPSDSLEKLSHHDEVLTIARTMPKLTQLSLAYLDINTVVVYEILLGCPDLELLDIRGCWFVRLDKSSLREKNPKIRVLGPDVSPGVWDRSCYDGFSDCSDDWMDYSDDEEEYDDDYWDAQQLEFQIYEGTDDWRDFGWPPSP